jgi:hypothetical protein
MKTRTRVANRKSSKKQNRTIKRKSQKGGNNVKCFYDKSTKNLIITTPIKIYEGNLSDVRPVCDKAINASLKKDYIKGLKEKKKVVKEEEHKTKVSKEIMKKYLKNFASYEDVDKDVGIYEGRRELYLQELEPIKTTIVTIGTIHKETPKKKK